MSYANGTTHYNLPLTVGTDKRDWFDTNEAFANVDADLNTAYTTANATASNVATLSDKVATTETNITNLQDADTQINARISTIGDSVTGLTTEVRDNKQDLSDAICSVVEASATAAYTHAVGSYFWYNDTLYITTVAIEIGDTIVPNTNCNTVTIATELVKTETVVVSVVGDGIKTVGQILTELETALVATGLSLSAKSYMVNGVNGTVFHINNIANKTFAYTRNTGDFIQITTFNLSNHTNFSGQVSSGGFVSTDYTSNAFGNGVVLELHI